LGAEEITADKFELAMRGDLIVIDADDVEEMDCERNGSAELDVKTLMTGIVS